MMHTGRYYLATYLLNEYVIKSVISCPFGWKMECLVVVVHLLSPTVIQVGEPAGVVYSVDRRCCRLAGVHLTYNLSTVLGVKWSIFS